MCVILSRRAWFRLINKERGKEILKLNTYNANLIAIA